MDKIKLNVLGLSYSQTQTGAYALVLAEEDGKRRLPIIIGTEEARSIAMQLEGIKPVRPLTHDLFLSLANSFNIELTEVNIVRVEQGIFYAKLICIRKRAKIIIDSRSSDAIALAIRFNCPIFASEKVMRKAGIYFDEKTGKMIASDENSEEKKKDEKKSYKDMTIKELDKLLKIVVEEEDYETASVIRDEITSREPNSGNDDKNITV